MHRPENDPGTRHDPVTGHNPGTEHDPGIGHDPGAGYDLRPGQDMIPAPAMIASPKRVEMCGVRNLANRFKINIIFFLSPLSFNNSTINFNTQLQ